MTPNQTARGLINHGLDKIDYTNQCPQHSKRAFLTPESSDHSLKRGSNLYATRTNLNPQHLYDQHAFIKPAYMIPKDLNTYWTLIRPS